MKVCNTWHKATHCRALGYKHHCCRPEDAQLRPWDGKSPASVAGAVIYAICSLPNAAKHCSAADIAQVDHCFLTGTKSLMHQSEL